jgi:hypothetical protein
MAAIRVGEEPLSSDPAVSEWSNPTDVSRLIRRKYGPHSVYKTLRSMNFQLLIFNFQSISNFKFQIENFFMGGKHNT